jgi:hypothetical protein
MAWHVNNELEVRLAEPISEPRQTFDLTDLPPGHF